jgi:pimeloyl-ACP methyl ester carboxylesterase
LGLGLLATIPASAVQAQDFGRMFERAARDTLRNQLNPNQLREAIRPGSQPAPGQAQGQPQPQPQPEPESFAFKTADNWTLVIRRYRPSQPQAGRLPVVLCHGLTYSAAFWDLEPPVSFARWLAARGWDVWAVDLRGCGNSQKWVFRLDDAPGAMIGSALRRATGGRMGGNANTSVDPRFANWTLDDHVDQDLPAVIRVVTRATGSPQVLWVGHSMGGIVPLCHMARYPNPGIARLATVGSQLTMRDGQLVMPFLQRTLLARQQQIAGQFGPREAAAMAGQGVQDLFFNVQNVSRTVYDALAAELMDIPAIGLMRQYTTMTSEGELWDAPRRFNYAQAAGNIQVPILITAGATDAFAPPIVQKDLFDRVGSPDKTAVIFGRARGLSAYSGHNDALVGLNSMRDVYPTIERWLRGEKV